MIFMAMLKLFLDSFDSQSFYFVALLFLGSTTDTILKSVYTGKLNCM